MTCGPYSSSRWAHERNDKKEMTVFKELKDSISKASFEKYGKLYQDSFDHEFVLDMNSITYNFNDKFYKELISIIPNIRCIVISGGEPLINDEFYDFIQWLIKNKFAENIDLIVFSNMTKLMKNYKAIYDEFNSFTINVSLDEGIKKR